MKHNADDETEDAAVKKLSSETMLTVRPSFVPEYLQESAFFRSLNAEDDTEFHIPHRVMKPDVHITTLRDACDLLHTIRFWGATMSLTPIVGFALSQPLQEVRSSFYEFENEFPLLRTMTVVMDESNGLCRRMEAAMEAGVIEFVQYVERSDIPFTMHALALAAGGGHADCLRYALTKPVAGDSSLAHPVFERAAAEGQLACLKVLNDSKLSVARYRGMWGGPPWRQYVANMPAKRGHLECLEYLDEMGCPTAGSLPFAAAGGNMPGLKYIVSRFNFTNFTSSFIGELACISAARHGQLDCLKYLYDVGCRVSPKSFVNLAEFFPFHCAGTFACVQFLLQNDCAWHFLVAHAAALHGRLSFLQFALDNGCPLLPSAFTKSKDEEYKSFFTVTKGPAHLVELVAQRNHWDCVEYLIAHDYPLTLQLTVQLAYNNQDRLLEQAVAHGCPVAVEAGVKYAKDNNVVGLTYALQHGCPPSVQILLAAARLGHLQCLVCASESGCPWSEEVATVVARGGHLECLQYAHLHGCPWNEETCTAAAREGRIQCLGYAHDQGCPWSQQTCAAAVKGGHLECLQYLRAHGCPWNKNILKAAISTHRNDIVQFIKDRMG